MLNADLKEDMSTQYFRFFDDKFFTDLILKTITFRPTSYSYFYSHIKVVFLLLIFPPPFGIPSPPKHFKSPLIAPAVHNQPDGITAHIWANPFHIGNAKGADHVFKGIFHHFSLRAAFWPLPFRALLEFAVSSSPNGE